ncbi:MAG: YkgJ family cysteine cluster protein [Lentisphaerae bacterium]|nr:YkgJ family cysteine cluster protein [Lentisphaerota bacterium]
MDKEFVCLRCGNCCRWPGYVRVSAQEVDAIAAFLGMSSGEFIDNFTRLTADRSGLSLLENPDGSCPYLEVAAEGPACKLQAVKPRQCCDFPLKWHFPGWEDECAGGRAMREKNNSESNR